jgi:hypothetical protein
MCGKIRPQQMTFSCCQLWCWFQHQLTLHLLPWSACCLLAAVYNQPFEFLATAASTGVMCMALAWVLFDFTDSPPPGGNFSSPRK